MLAGAEPERIQCLTFTKAAAAEMAVRLQQTARQVGDVGYAGAGTRTARPARGADATDVAGRARIVRRKCSTCRAACASAPSTPSASRCCAGSRWRRELSPHFRLVDDRDADDALTEAREDMLAQRRADAPCAPRWTRIAGLATVAQFGSSSTRCSADRERLRARARLAATALEAAQRARSGCNAANETGDRSADAVHWRRNEADCAKRRGRWRG